MTLRHPVSRLQELLESWEDYFFLSTAIHDSSTQGSFGNSALCTGPFRHYGEFRDYLLTARPDDEFDSERFYACDPSLMLRSVLGNRETGKALFEWTAKSRRVYRLDKQMGLLLANTALQGVRWSEVKLPFDAFAITLEEPMDLGMIINPDCFIVFKVKQGRREEIVILASGPNEKPHLRVTPDRRAKLQKMRRRRQWGTLQKHAGRSFNRTQKGSPKVFRHFAPVNDVAIVDTAEHVARHSFQMQPVAGEDHRLDEQKLMPVYRLIAGLCLYIASLPSKHTQASGFDGQAIVTQDPTAIVNGAEVMGVTNCYTLSPAEEDALEELETRRGEISAHWRRGFWRRPRGQGHIPNAPKTVWVRPTLVRADRLPESGLPGGTKLTIKAPKD